MSLTNYLQGQSEPLNLPLDIKASSFQLKVWSYLQTIPRGETRTYGEVAKAVGEPGASRAVGTACGSNKVALVIPCHRVIRGDRGLGGIVGAWNARPLCWTPKKSDTLPGRGE